MIHGFHSQLKTNKQQQPPTTKPDPKAPSSVFHPEFMNMQPQSHGTLVQLQMLFLFSIGGDFVEVSTSTYHSLAPRGKRFFMQKTQGGWPRRICGAGRAWWESSNDVYIRGYLDGFFHPQESLENTIDTMGTVGRGTPNCPFDYIRIGNTLPPIIMVQWNMAPSNINNISFLSFRVHFHVGERVG